MSDLSQAPAFSSAPYLWSLILSFGALRFSIILLYIVRFSARLEFKDLGSLRSMFDLFLSLAITVRFIPQGLFC